MPFTAYIRNLHVNVKRTGGTLAVACNLAGDKCIQFWATRATRQCLLERVQWLVPFNVDASGRANIIIAGADAAAVTVRMFRPRRRTYQLSLQVMMQRITVANVITIYITVMIVIMNSVVAMVMMMVMAAVHVMHAGRRWRLACQIRQ